MDNFSIFGVFGQRKTFLTASVIGTKIKIMMMLNYRSTGFELASIERMNLANIQGEKSDAYPLIRERRTTQKIGQIHTPYQETQKWLISSLLLLNVPLRHTFVVVPRNHLIFELLNLTIALIPYSYS